MKFVKIGRRGYRTRFSSFLLPLFGPTSNRCGANKSQILSVFMKLFPFDRIAPLNIFFSDQVKLPVKNWLLRLSEDIDQQFVYDITTGE